MKKSNVEDMGKRRYEKWHASLVASSENRRHFEEGCADIELWLALVEGRIATGIPPEKIAQQEGIPLAHVMRIECGEIADVPLKSLRQYAHGVGRTEMLVAQLTQSHAVCAEQSEGRSEKKAS